MRMMCHPDILRLPMHGIQMGGGSIYFLVSFQLKLQIFHVVTIIILLPFYLFCCFLFFAAVFSSSFSTIFPISTIVFHFLAHCFSIGLFFCCIICNFGTDLHSKYFTCSKQVTLPKKKIKTTCNTTLCAVRCKKIVFLFFYSSFDRTNKIKIQTTSEFTVHFDTIMAPILT